MIMMTDANDYHRLTSFMHHNHVIHFVLYTRTSSGCRVRKNTTRPATFLLSADEEGAAAIPRSPSTTPTERPCEGTRTSRDGLTRTRRTTTRSLQDDVREEIDPELEEHMNRVGQYHGRRTRWNVDLRTENLFLARNGGGRWRGRPPYGWSIIMGPGGRTNGGIRRRMDYGRWIFWKARVLRKPHGTTYRRMDDPDTVDLENYSGTENRAHEDERDLHRISSSSDTLWMIA
ncbi:unnamed protein product [Amoebophrya sp. A120]|nr:unnamed protein product [Amoebophrya sp. A120]|eukprot:GSA120T00021765001.1